MLLCGTINLTWILSVTFFKFVKCICKNGSGGVYVLEGGGGGLRKWGSQDGKNCSPTK
jgi:hypothetical protein